MRSLLFVPADSPKKLAKGMTSGADALILDLEDAVTPAAKSAARATVRDFLNAARGAKTRPRLFVRINAFVTGLADGDLEAVMAAAPDGIMLPKCGGGSDVTLLDAKLGVHEALAGLTDGATRILALATETPGSLFTLGTYASASPRLEGMTWGAEDLSVALGAETNRLTDGSYTDPYRLARALTLAAAAAAEVTPIDSVYVSYRDLTGLRTEAEAGRRDGFAAKMAIHPDQVAVINEVFTPSADSLARAKRVVAAFAADPGAGVIGLDGEMLDQPHLKRAERLLARAKAVRAA
ncbi:MAG TPA: CoA ester lyase [Xanthobacteraceae bacterium]|nr:CoA ester lyase [Xanthobacteraceae bacterium]